MYRLKFKTLCLFFILFFVLFTGCQKKEVPEKDENKKKAEENTNVPSLEEGNYYISMTTTHETSQEELKTDIYMYDIKNNKISKELTIDDTSQYPLSCVDMNRHCIYYAAADGVVGDQLYVQKMQEDKSYKITNDLYAINYIVPTTKGIYLAACQTGHHTISPFYYDFSTDKLKTLSWDEDFFLELMYYDVDSDKIYVSGYSNKEDEKYCESKKSPSCFIYEIDSEGNHTLICKTKNMRITKLFARNNQIWYVTQNKRLSPSDETKYRLYEVNKDGKNSVTKVKLEQEQIRGLGVGTFVTKDDRIFSFCDGKLYHADNGFTTKVENRTIIFSVSGKEAINNIQILKVNEESEIIPLSILGK